MILKQNEKHRSLDGKQLKGTISTEFGNLTQLQTL